MSRTALRMTADERHASVSLAGLFACRMLGLFLLLPVFAVAAAGLPGGTDPLRVGLALGAYGLTQAVMQIPFGMASDRWGRRPVVLAGLLLFVVGSVICALADDLLWITLGRAIQGAGAISAAVTAWLADLTRESVRTRAMAMVGGAIGLSFAVSLIAAPLLVGWGGLSGLFWAITVLGVGAVAVAAWGVPRASLSQPAIPSADQLPGGTTRIELARLNLGVFVLHLVQVALFVVVPGLLVQLGGLAAQDLWQVYLPVILLSFVGMVPVVFVAERHRAHRNVLRLSVAALVLVLGALWMVRDSFTGLVAALTLFFVAFNVLEALQPSLVSRLASPVAKGRALGFYNTAQAIGLFLGGGLGGWLAAEGGSGLVFATLAGLVLVWLLVAWGMRPLPAPRA